MTATIDRTDVADGRKPSERPYQIMFLVKRRSYELAIAIPHAPQVAMAQDHPRLHVCLKASRQSGAFRLDLATLQCFQQDLLSLTEAWS
jgi:hypothetical protein